MTDPLISLRGVTKTYGTLVANDHIDLDIYPGVVHAIVGENGAGKTTLASLLNGTGTPDSGTILVDGRPVTIKTPRQAGALGIGMVFQHFRLVGSLTVAANVFLGRELTRGGLLDAGAMAARVSELSRRFGLEVDPGARVRDLSVGAAQRVEVLKALSHDTRVLILDEPTAVLTPQESVELFGVIRGLAQAGVAVVFISHKLDEVTAVADELTVLRDGRVIAILPAAGQTRESIARLMVGRDLPERVNRGAGQPGEVVLAARGLRVRDARGVRALDGVSLEVRAGEIVGVAGVDGNGQAELVGVLTGMLRADAGTVALLGADVTRSSVRRRRALGLAHIPDDRRLVGTAPGMSVAENLAATHLGRKDRALTRAGWIVGARVREFARELIGEFGIRGAAPGSRAGTLSGGNLQKVVIAREFAGRPSVLVVSQPTRGLDVGATEAVHDRLLSARDRGAGLLVVSADLGEIGGLADRVLVMHRGTIVAEFSGDEVDATAIGLAMGGVRADDAHSSINAAGEQVATDAEGVQMVTDAPGVHVGWARNAGLGNVSGYPDGRACRATVSSSRSPTFPNPAHGDDAGGVGHGRVPVAWWGCSGRRRPAARSRGVGAVQAAASSSAFPWRRGAVQVAIRRASSSATRAYASRGSAGILPRTRLSQVSASRLSAAVRNW